MQKAIIAKKIGMTQVFTENGNLVGVTVLEAGPCVVVQKKTKETDGYEALQVGFGPVTAKHVNKPLKGHFAKAGVEIRKVLRELRLDSIEGFEVGALIKADVFAAGDHVDVSGVSKGKGYQGAVRKYNQRTGPVTHGSKYHRAAGSMGASASPSRVMKGKGMPSHMGHEKITTQNLEVVRADGDANLLLIRGSVPGPNGTIVMVKNTVKV